jgi:hypothetical protein
MVDASLAQVVFSWIRSIFRPGREVFWISGELAGENETFARNMILEMVMLHFYLGGLTKFVESLIF